MYHKPVLLTESVDALVSNPDGVYVDVTFGGGGHSREILSRLSEKGRLFSFDQDSDALNNAIEDSRFTLINQNFRFLENSLLMYGVAHLDSLRRCHSFYHNLRSRSAYYLTIFHDFIDEKRFYHFTIIGYSIIKSSKL